MLTKSKNNRGFTLIELIIVIAILGILAAVVVPKFFDSVSDAHTANEKAVIGTIKASLNMYASQQLVDNGARAFPDADDIVSDGDFSSILDEEPANWTVTDGDDDDEAKFTYSGGTSDVVYVYDCDGGSSYTLTKQ